MTFVCFVWLCDACQADNLRRQVVELRQDATLQSELAEDYKDMVKVKQRQQADLQRQIEELAGDSQQHTEQLQALQALLAEKQQALEIASREVAEMQREWKGQRAQLQDSAKASDEKAAEAQRALQAQQAHSAAAKAEADALRGELRDLKAQARGAGGWVGRWWVGWRVCVRRGVLAAMWWPTCKVAVSRVQGALLVLATLSVLWMPIFGDLTCLRWWFACPPLAGLLQEDERARAATELAGQLEEQERRHKAEKAAWSQTMRKASTLFSSFIE